MANKRAMKSLHHGIFLADAARDLGVTYLTVADWVKDGILPHSWRSGRICIPSDDWEDFKAARLAVPTKPEVSE